MGPLKRAGMKFGFFQSLGTLLQKSASGSAGEPPWAMLSRGTRPTSLRSCVGGLTLIDLPIPLITPLVLTGRLCIHYRSAAYKPILKLRTAPIE